MISSVDPVEAGYLTCFARPGGNITGLAHLGRDLSAKRVELLKELATQVVEDRCSLGCGWSGASRRF